MLQLAPSDHEVDDFLDDLLGVLLLGKVLQDGVLRHLGANGEPALELLLHSVEELLVLVGKFILKLSKIFRNKFIASKEKVSIVIIKYV